ESFANSIRVNLKTLPYFHFLISIASIFTSLDGHLLYKIALVHFSYLMTKLHLLSHLLKKKPPKIFIILIVV
ncbi:hypothetical protein DSQ34_25275, partial [Salmonella enterica]|nr:hypothetical protein [Salmonella enterica]